MQYGEVDTVQESLNCRLIGASVLAPMIRAIAGEREEMARRGCTEDKPRDEDG
jgi:hypothetical protein